MTRCETLPALLRRPAFAPSAARTGGARSGAGEASYLAQTLGQGGERRGLRGGSPVLASARSAYLGAEWAGAGERRAPPGAMRRASV